MMIKEKCLAFMSDDKKSIVYDVSLPTDRIRPLLCRNPNVLLDVRWVKAWRKLLMKLTRGVDFSNVFQAAFMLKDPKSNKRH